MRWQTGAAVAVLAALAAVAVIAFAQDAGTPEVEASAAPTVTASPSPSPVTPSPSESPSPQLVLPDNDVEDPLEAIVAIEAYRDWLFENPDPDLVRFIYHPECLCTEPLVDALQELDDAGHVVRIKGGGTTVSDRSLEQEQTDRVVVVRYSVAAPAFDVVDESGATTESHDPAGPRHLRVQLLRSDGGRWIVVHIEELE